MLSMAGFNHGGRNMAFKQRHTQNKKRKKSKKQEGKKKGALAGTKTKKKKSRSTRKGAHACNPESPVRLPLPLLQPPAAAAHEHPMHHCSQGLQECPLQPGPALPCPALPCLLQWKQ